MSARKLGYKDVYVMTSGILGWKKAGKPIETGITPAPSITPSAP